MHLLPEKDIGSTLLVLPPHDSWPLRSWCLTIFGFSELSWTDPWNLRN